VPAVDVLDLLAAAARARARGVEIEVFYMQAEDMATQAVLAGEAEVGVGAPYQLIAETGAPLRIFFQLSKLRFYPVVDTEYFRSWADLDGAEMVTHGPGSGTETIMKRMAKEHGIEYSRMHYSPGSAVRARAMLRGQYKATIVDLLSYRFLRQAGGNRYATLPIPALHASDETLYARMDVLEDRREELDVFLDELLWVWRRVNSEPSYLVEARREFDLLPELLSESDDEIRAYFVEQVAAGTLADDGGGRAAALADLDFYLAGLVRPKGSKILSLEDYWFLDPLEQALSRAAEDRAGEDGSGK
jgi:NitT/TauT family transport system substrate-binding protein